ncbi:MAG: hypothetical protein SGBAC_013458, partial [Bacillariaceae sp.]
DSIVKVYWLGNGDEYKFEVVKTCAATHLKHRRALLVTESFTWFDVGEALSEIILVKRHVEDAFLIGSILEAPLETLLLQGFDFHGNEDGASNGEPSDVVDPESRTADANDDLLMPAQPVAAVASYLNAEQQKQKHGNDDGEDAEPPKENVAERLFPTSLTSLVSSASLTAQSAASKVSDQGVSKYAGWLRLSAVDMLTTGLMTIVDDGGEEDEDTISSRLDEPLLDKQDKP